jgi:hypothetical protein
MANKKKHLSFEERFCIEKMLKVPMKEGLSATKSFGEIARTLKRG